MDESIEKALKVSGLILAGIGIGVGGYFIGKHFALKMPKEMTWPGRNVNFFDHVKFRYPEMCERQTDIIVELACLLRDNSDVCVKDIGVPIANSIECTPILDWIAGALNGIGVTIH